MTIYTLLKTISDTYLMQRYTLQTIDTAILWKKLGAWYYPLIRHVSGDNVHGRVVGR